ncbi:MAG: sigma-70 family RNA polymerase sigma factor [bacterium]
MRETRKDSDRQDAQDLALFLVGSDTRAGREAAARLLGRHQARVYLWCYRFVRDHDLALDLAQDVLLAAYQKLPEYEHRARFSSWLFIIARNRCLSEVRRPTWQAALEIDPDELTSGNPGPVQALEERDLWRFLESHLDRQELDALHLRCVEGIPVDSITEILGIDGPSGARGVLQRARRKLRAAFGTEEGMRRGLAHDA